MKRLFWKKFRWKKSSDDEIPEKNSGEEYSNEENSSEEKKFFFCIYENMVNKYYQKHKEKLWKRARERY